MTSRLERIQAADSWRAKTSTTLDRFMDYAVQRISVSEEKDPTLRVLDTALDLCHAMGPQASPVEPIEPEYFAYCLAEAMYRLLEKDGRV